MIKEERDEAPNVDVLKAFVEAQNIATLWEEGRVPLFKASDVGVVLGSTTIRTSTRHSDSKEKVVRQWFSPGGPQETLFLTYARVRRLLVTSRKPAAARMAKAFGMKVHDNHYVRVEAAAVDFISTALDGLNMIQQYRVGPYRVDLYFPDHKIALECNEEGAHGAGRISQDRERQIFIEKHLSCRFIRFRPQQKKFTMAKLLNIIIRELSLI
jgi:very-short-patch-repair endonuclease